MSRTALQALLSFRISPITQWVIIFTYKSRSGQMRLGTLDQKGKGYEAIGDFLRPLYRNADSTVEATAML